MSVGQINKPLNSIKGERVPKKSTKDFINFEIGCFVYQKIITNIHQCCLVQDEVTLNIFISLLQRSKETTKFSIAVCYSDY